MHNASAIFIGYMAARLLRVAEADRRAIAIETGIQNSGIGSTIVLILIPLFMADFSKNIGMAKLNARYHLWVNIGCLVAPLFALNIAEWFGNYRIPFLASAMIYAGGLLFFRRFGIVQQEKEIKKVSPRRTIKALWINTLAFFRCPGMPRAYCVNFGYYALYAMRILYVPIIVIEQGFPMRLSVLRGGIMTTVW